MPTKNDPFQMSLNFDPPRARRSDPETSHVAAEKASHGQRPMEIIGALLMAPNGLTTSEIGTVLGVPRDYISPHMKKLEKRGLAKRAGLRSRGKYGRIKSEVWHATVPEAMRHLFASPKRLQKDEYTHLCPNCGHKF